MSIRKLILILIAAAFVAYFSSFGNPFIWDDEQFITSNSYVQNFDIEKIFTTNTVAGAGVQSNYYRPLSTLSFAVDAKLWGINPFGFHLTNFLFHLGSGLILFGLLIRLFSMAEGDSGLYPAFFIALFFLIHPVQTEAVTYINSRGDSMYAFFLFLSLWLFVKMPKNIALFRILAIIFLYICSLLLKEIALAGLGLFILIWWLCLSLPVQTRGLIQKNKKIQLLLLNLKVKSSFQNNSFFIVSILTVMVTIYLILRTTVLNFGNTFNFYGFDNEYTRSLLVRLFTFCKVLWVYFGILLWPYPLHMERTVELVRSFWDPWVLSILVLFLLVFVLAWRQFKKGNPWILFGFLWFLIMLIPGSGIIPVNGILYEHWLYLPMVGILIMLYGAWNFLGPMIQSIKTTKILISFVVFISILYIFLTIRQNNIWADPITFYRYTLQFAPWSARLHNNLAMTYAQTGGIDQAILEYRKGIKLGASYPQIHYNLGNAYIAKGENELAKREYQEALQLAPEWELPKEKLKFLNFH